MFSLFTKQGWFSDVVNYNFTKLCSKLLSGSDSDSPVVESIVPNSK